MKTLNSEVELGNAYSEWIDLRNAGYEAHSRFGQYVYNTYGLEYRNSRNVRSELDAYNLLSEYVYLKGLEDATK